MKSGTSDAMADFDDQTYKTSPEKTRLGIDQSPINRVGNKSSFMSIPDQDLTQVTDGHYRPNTYANGDGQAYLKTSESTINRSKDLVGLLAKQGDAMKGHQNQNHNEPYSSDQKNVLIPRNSNTSAAGLSLTLTGFESPVKDRAGSVKDPNHESVNNEATDQHPEMSDQEKAEMHLDTMKTPSFNLSSQKNFKFATSESKKSGLDTPKVMSSRYIDLSPDSKLPTNVQGRLGSESARLLSSPDRPLAHSSYRIDTEQEKLYRSPGKDKRGLESPQCSYKSPHKHSCNHHEFGSPGSSHGYYPIKRTCDPRMESCYYDSVNSCSKCSPQKNGGGYSSSKMSPGQMRSPTQSVEKQSLFGLDGKLNDNNSKEINVDFLSQGGYSQPPGDLFKSEDEPNFDIYGIPTIYSKQDVSKDIIQTKSLQKALEVVLSKSKQNPQSLVSSQVPTTINIVNDPVPSLQEDYEDITDNRVSSKFAVSSNKSFNQHPSIITEP